MGVAGSLPWPANALAKKWNWRGLTTCFAWNIPWGEYLDVCDKKERLQEFFRRMENAEPASNHDEAFALIAATLKAVEDELTNIPDQPHLWLVDGRMYPPQPDSRRAYSPLPGWARYRSRGHNILISPHGEIEIREVNGQCIFSKQGK